MSNRRILFMLGLVSFVLGGVLLVFAREGIGTPVGTTCGLAGLGLMIWSWAGRK